ncbi:MAG: M23 family metallopeptidase [Anaerotignum sp.]|nr:M23 family metallopeptidase [Anaerotignum sp.]
MKRNENKTARRMQTFAICGCLCLLALGAGVTYRAFDRGQAQPPAEESRPVTMAKTLPLDAALLERQKRSNDAGETPDTNPTEQPAKQPAQQSQQQEQPKQNTAEPVFAYPLTGEVVLPYSMDHAIYDPTLDQYRTNGSVSLSAEQGTAVKAAADGQVKEVRQDMQMGNTVVIEHTNGWLTTYGQLAEDVEVKEGDRVEQGQTIGAVDKPTKYGVALGTHLEFAMEKDGTPVNPQEKLQKTEGN